MRNLYHGVMTTITRAAVLGATKMATYDQCKVELKEGSWTRGFGWTESRDDPERWTERYKVQFAASIVTGLAVTMTTSPVTNARTHIMCNPPGKFRGTLHCWSDIIRTQVRRHQAVHQQRLWIRLLTEAVVQGPLGLYRGFGAQWARFGPYVRRIDTLSNSPFHSISCETEMPLAFRCWRRR